MDDGWEMSDGVQAKVPIRGQPEGGVSPTGANGRRLGETAAVATRSAPPSQPQPPREVLCFSSALHFLPTCSMHGSCFYVPFETGMHVCNRMRLQKVLMCSCMYDHECGRNTEGKGVYVCMCVGGCGVGWEGVGGLECLSGG